MKPVSRKKAKELEEAGWVRKTYFVYLYIDGEWIWMTQNDAIEFMRKTKTEHAILSAPTLDEVLEDRTPYDIARYVIFEEDVEKLHGISLMKLALQQIWTADKAADVWIKTRRKV